MVVGALEAERDDLGCNARALWCAERGWFREETVVSVVRLLRLVLHVAVVFVSCIVVDSAAAFIRAAWCLLRD